jgi:RNA-directed DNA polymerase
VREAIEDAIVRKSKAILADQQIAAATKLKYADRFTKRTGAFAGAPVIQEPRWWQFHPHFEPKYCIRHARFLAKTIWQKLVDGTYEPIPAVKFDIPKPDGTTRDIMAFAIPDAAVANVFHRSITRRNLNLFSSHSFAYRPDQNVFDAILHLRRSLGNPKSYVVQYDFKKYFDTIDPNYLMRLVENRELFLITGAERVAIKSFLRHEFAHVNDYQSGGFGVRTRGVPQGCSLSLFLSNAAAHELDLALDRQDGTFARFADDVVAVAHSYTAARNIALQFRAHCKVAGIEVNYEKSPGILLFDRGKEGDVRTFFVDGDDGGRINTIKEFDYLGHKLSRKGVSLSDRAIKKVKRRISEIIYKHLFLYRRSPPNLIDPQRVGPGFYDWDLVTCLNEIRRYLYGGLRERQIESFLAGEGRLPFVRGVLAFYPLITDPCQLASLDGWLANVLLRANRERVRVLQSFGVVLNPLPKTEVISGDWYDYPPVYNDTRLPSFVRGWRAARRYYLRYGLKNIEPPSYYSLLTY